MPRSFNHNPYHFASWFRALSTVTDTQPHPTRFVIDSTGVSILLVATGVVTRNKTTEFRRWKGQHKPTEKLRELQHRKELSFSSMMRAQMSS